MVVEKASSMPLTEGGPLLSVSLQSAKFHTFAVCDPRHAYIPLQAKLRRKYKGYFFSGRYLCLWERGFFPWMPLASRCPLGSSHPSLCPGSTWPPGGRSLWASRSPLEKADLPGSIQPFCLLAPAIDPGALSPSP